MTIDQTHDPKLKSWVESANAPGSEFPIQNLPFGVFCPKGETQSHPGVAIGDLILPLDAWLDGADLSSFMRLPAVQRRDLRREISRALEKGALRRDDLLAQRNCRMQLPVSIGDYTDFYASRYHAERVGRIFRPTDPLPRSYDQLPIAYHGRSSSIFVSGSSVKRPCGQLGAGRFGATEELDYEVELGMFIGPGNAAGSPIPIAEAEDHLVGFCALNDWSARDIQRWEYQPLGPFLGKNFATSISPWIVTSEALAPFRTTRPAHLYELPYLQCDAESAFDIGIEAFLTTQQSESLLKLSSARAADLYWTPAQMIAHHTSNGCPLRPGDLVGSGTVSGPMHENGGCLLELTAAGRTPIALSSGEQRVFLHDRDEITITARCKSPEYVSVGFGMCTGRIEPSATAVS